MSSFTDGQLWIDAARSLLVRHRRRSHELVMLAPIALVKSPSLVLPFLFHYFVDDWLLALLACELLPLRRRIVLRICGRWVGLSFAGPFEKLASVCCFFAGALPTGTVRVVCGLRNLLERGFVAFASGSKLCHARPVAVPGAVPTEEVTPRL